MDPEYSRLLSDDVHNFMRSPVREIFKKVDLGSIYSFAGGYPNASTFPTEDIKRICAEVIDRYGSKALQYGATQGVVELREAVAHRYGVPVSRVQITTSSQQGIDICTRILVNPSDVILTSSPTYLGAIQSFKSYRADIRPMLSWDEKTCGVESATLSKAKFCYVIPDFQNPSGETMTLREREQLAALSRKYGFIIVEDSPYRELRYTGSPVRTIYSLAPERTIHLGSFSKIFAPGFRLGWAIGPEELLDSIYVCKQSLDLCPPVLDQYIAAEKYMPAGVSWTHPEGGLFLFLTLPEGTDTVALYDKALSAGVAYVAGSFFYPDGSHRNTMRLNFSFLDKDKMEDGIRILSQIITR